MTLRSRLIVGLLTMLVVLAMASSSFAQVQLTLTPFPSAGEIQTNQTAQTADPGAVGAGILITGALLAQSPLTTTNLRLVFPAPITSSPLSCINGSATIACITVGASNVPSADPIRIEGATGVFAEVSNPRLNTANSRVEITLPGLGTNANPNSQSGSFRIVGVRIDANGKTGAQSVTASLSDTTANYLLLTPGPLTVISNIAAGTTASVGARAGNISQGTATIFTNRTVPKGTASFILTEGFASAFRTPTQSGNSGVGLPNGSDIRLTFNNVPAGVTINLSMNVPAGSGANALNAGFGTTTPIATAVITSASNTTNVRFIATSLTNSESVEIDVTSITLTTTAAVTTPSTITVTATFNPIGTVLDSVGLPSQTSGYPLFTQADVGPITVVNITSSSTTMLLALAEKVFTFDTGISVANTTADPFGGSSGGGATAQAGTLRFDFFPSTATGAGTPCFLQTSATSKPGNGISSDGSIASGATYTVLLSQLLTASNCPAGDFVGYVFVTANFLNAHGAATITDFRTFSLAAPFVVLPPPSVAPRSAPAHASLGNGVETLMY